MKLRMMLFSKKNKLEGKIEIFEEEIFIGNYNILECVGNLECKTSRPP